MPKTEAKLILTLSVKEWRLVFRAVSETMRDHRHWFGEDEDRATATIIFNRMKKQRKLDV